MRKMKKYIEEPKRTIEVVKEVDVLVVGAGPAGVSAAICAAREGAQTLLVDQAGDVGGIATVGLMSHWTGNTQGGFYEEILERSADSKKRGGSDFNGDERQIINPERLKTVLLEMLQEAGAQVQLYTFACDVILEGDTIRGIITESKSGREAILAKIVIDATGDGDLAAKAGVPFYLGRETDGKMQPATIMFKVAGVDMEKAVFAGGFEDTFPIPAGDLQTVGKTHLPSPAGHVLLYRTTLPGVVTCNMTNCIDVDGTKTGDLTKAVYTCRTQMDKIVDFLREYIPGYENCYLISSASLIGIRETRHFRGEATITEQDILEARVFDDWAVTKASFNFDVHNMSGNGLDETGCQKKFTQKKGYTIPYGCFIPQKIENLFLAGRDISGTHMAHSNYRVMPICANMGQSVGIAAAMCSAGGILPRDLDVRLLQKRLTELGVEP